MSYHMLCSRTLDSNPRKSNLSSWTKKKIFRNYIFQNTGNEHIRRRSCVYAPLATRHISSLISVISLRKLNVLVPHEISWVFRHLVLESQSNTTVLTSVRCISDGLRVMVLPKVRSSLFPFFTFVRLISKSLPLLSDGDRWLCKACTERQITCDFMCPVSYLPL